MSWNAERNVERERGRESTKSREMHNPFIRNQQSGGGAGCQGNAIARSFCTGPQYWDLAGTDLEFVYLEARNRFNSSSIPRMLFLRPRGTVYGVGTHPDSMLSMLSMLHRVGRISASAIINSASDSLLLISCANSKYWRGKDHSP
jgi:hypothetical protein